MTTARYQEYLELFSYFGRDGLPRLNLVQFRALDAEFDQLLAAPRPLDPALIARVGELKALLLRDRPKLAELTRSRCATGQGRKK
ncbi:MAG: hypothetical protein H6707_07925 [Deltaproteobacteria bacterium]|nr:hypothetical protein [Deltaproteobacteria bacterium]